MRKKGENELTMPDWALEQQEEAPQEAEMQAAETPEAPVDELQSLQERCKALETELAQAKSILSRLTADMDVQDLGQLSGMIDDAEVQALIAKENMSEPAARMFLAQQGKLRSLRDEQARQKRSAAITQLRSDPLYADIDGRESEIEAYAAKTGLSPKEAYHALYAESRLRDLQRRMEEESARTAKQGKKIPALSGGSMPDGTPLPQLSAQEAWAAEKAGMTPAEYAKYKYTR